MNSSRIEAIEILLVEDSDADATLTVMALEEGRIANNVHRVTDGEQAMDFLYQRGAYGEVPRPDLVLLDLNMPRKDGREVLAEIRADTELRPIPVIVLTTSDGEEDVLASYNLAANCYVRKPVDVDQFMNAIRVLKEFWFSVVRLPT